jgi:hypothetical protein
MSQDPIIDMTTPQTMNAYSYVANNPVNFVDPSGAVATQWRIVWSDGDGNTVASTEWQTSNISGITGGASSLNITIGGVNAGTVSLTGGSRSVSPNGRITTFAGTAALPAPQKAGARFESPEAAALNGISEAVAVQKAQKNLKGFKGHSGQEDTWAGYVTGSGNEFENTRPSKSNFTIHGMDPPFFANLFGNVAGHYQALRRGDPGPNLSDYGGGLSERGMTGWIHYPSGRVIRVEGGNVKEIIPAR